MRLLLLCLLASTALAVSCQCQYNSSLVCSTDIDCADAGACLCPTNVNETLSLATTTPPPPTSTTVDSSGQYATQASEQQYVEATIATMTDSETAGIVVGLMFVVFAVLGVVFALGWMRVL